MIGEFDFTDMFFAHKHEFGREFKVNFPGATYAIFIVFLILMPIIIMNLLTALAVDDVNKLREKAHLEVQRLRIELTLDLNVYDKTRVFLQILLSLRDGFSILLSGLWFLLRCLCCSRKAQFRRTSQDSDIDLLNKNLVEEPDLPGINKAVYMNLNLETNKYQILDIPIVYLYTSWAIECNAIDSEPWWNHFLIYGLRSIIGKKLVDQGEKDSLVEEREILLDQFVKHQDDKDYQTKNEIDHLNDRLNQIEAKMIEYQNEFNESVKELGKKIDYQRKYESEWSSFKNDTEKKLQEQLEKTDKNRRLDFLFQTEILKDVKEINKEIKAIKIEKTAK